MAELEGMAGPEGKICKLCRYAQGMCQIGFRKSHERTDPRCRLHGVTGRASGAKSAPKRQASPPPRGETPATTSAMTTHPDKVLFRTRRGLHLQHDPEPSIDQWINSDVQFDWEKGRYIKPTGEVLNATEEGTLAQYRRRHIVRCRAGDLADKLTRMVDKYLPRVANESRLYIMRFPETIPKLLKRVRKIRRRIKATKQGDTKMAVQTSRKGERQRHETRGSTAESSVPKPRGTQTEQHATKEHDDEQESIPDWGDDVANDVMDTAEEKPTTTTAAHVAEGDDATAMWPWGNRGRPSDKGESVGVLAQRPNLPTVPRRQSSQRGSTLQQAVQMVQAHMAQQREERGRLRQELSRD